MALIKTNMEKLHIMKRYIVDNADRLEVMDKEHLIYILKINERADAIKLTGVKHCVDLDKLDRSIIDQIYSFVYSKIGILNSEFQ